MSVSYTHLQVIYLNGQKIKFRGVNRHDSDPVTGFTISLEPVSYTHLFIFNKDADTMQCPAGHLAIKYRIDKRSNQKKNTRIKYFFDINTVSYTHLYR